MSLFQYDTTPANNATAADDINWSTGIAPSLVDDNAKQQMADIADWLLDVACSITTGGTASAMTASTNSTLTALRDGLILGFVVGTAANAGATLNVDGLGAKPLYVDGSAISSGHLPAGHHFIVTYDASVSSGVWVVHNAADILADGFVTNAKLANMAQYRVKGRVASGSGAPTDLTANNLATILGQITTSIDFNSQRLTSVADPASAQHAATRNYVDNKTFNTSNYADSSVTAVKIANDAVIRDKILDTAVSFAKMQNISQYAVIGRVSAGSGAPEALDGDDLATILGQASLAIELPVNVVTSTLNLSSSSGVGYQLSTTGAIRAQRPNSAADTDALFAGYKGTTLKAQIEANGDFQSATNSYGATSDRRLKRDIRDMRPALERLMALPLHEGRLRDEVKAQGKRAPFREFVIADEVEAAGFKGLVKTDAETTVQSVNYSGLYIKTIKALQEAVTEYREEIAALKSRVASLENV